MEKIPNKKFLFDQLGNAYINGERVGHVVACVKIKRGKYIELPKRGYFSLKVREVSRIKK